MSCWSCISSNSFPEEWSSTFKLQKFTPKTANYGSGSLRGLFSTDNMYIDSDGTGMIPQMLFIAVTNQAGFSDIGGRLACGEAKILICLPIISHNHQLL